MSDTKHKPTTPANREAALRFQAQQLLRDAATWGYTVYITSTASERSKILVVRNSREADEAAGWDAARGY